jgi:DNA-directed RNA polymerase specialized sigma24 family protein
VFRVLYEGVRTKFYDVPQGGHIWGLLFVLAMNKIRDQISYHRAARRNVRRTTGVDVHNWDDLFGKDESAATLLRMEVEDYLSKLEEPDRAIIALRMTGHSVGEVAEQTGRAKRSVERVLQKARDQLMELLRP